MTEENFQTPCPVCGNYNNRGITIDALLVRNGKILLVKRGKPPFQHMWALPGGHVVWNEDTLTSVKREVKEETNLRVTHARLFNVYSKPDRDPFQKITLAYIVDAIGTPKAGDDASAIAWFDLMKLPVLASDHRDIIEDYITQVAHH